MRNVTLWNENIYRGSQDKIFIAEKKLWENLWVISFQDSLFDHNNWYRATCNLWKFLLQDTTDIKALSTVIKMIFTTTKHLDFNNLNPIYTARLSPTKIAKHLNKPLGNFESFVNVIKQCIEKSFELMPKVSVCFWLCQIKYSLWIRLKFRNLWHFFLYLHIPDLLGHYWTVSKIKGGFVTFPIKVTLWRIYSKRN